MLSLNYFVFKNKSIVRFLFSYTIILFSIFACSSAPIQEMSDARQLITIVNEEIKQAKLKDNYAIEDIMVKAKKQLLLATHSLEQNEYSLAKKYAVKAAKLAQLARTEMQQKKK